MDRLIHVALIGKPVAWFSPTNKFLADTWRELQSTLAPVILEKNEQEKRLVLLGAGVMELWSLRKYITTKIFLFSPLSNRSPAVFTSPPVPRLVPH
jgi:hypothetical protein